MQTIITSIGTYNLAFAVATVFALVATLVYYLWREEEVLDLSLEVENDALHLVDSQGKLVLKGPANNYNDEVLKMERLTVSTAALDRASERHSANTKYIDGLFMLDYALKCLKGFTEVAVDCEGVNLGRGGKLCLLQVGAKDNTIFIIDVLKLGDLVFKRGIKEILESDQIKKVMFDCRRDSDSLWHEYRVKLTNVRDMQLFEYINRVKARKENKAATRPFHYKRPVVRGMNKTMELYVGLSHFAKIKEHGGNLMKEVKGVWGCRPLSKGLITYAALDIQMIWMIFDVLCKYTSLVGVHEERLKIASERYAAVRRDHEEAINRYTENCLLLSLIIPDIKGNRCVPFPDGNHKCNGCRRFFPGYWIRNNLCMDCKEIERVSAFHNNNVFRQFRKK